VLFVGAAAVLEPEHAIVGAAPMPAAPKKSSVATNCFLRSAARPRPCGKDFYINILAF